MIAEMTLTRAAIQALITLVVSGFWIWMLVDCVIHERGWPRVWWFLAILVCTGTVGGPLYLFFRLLPRKRRERAARLATPPPLPRL